MPCQIRKITKKKTHPRVVAKKCVETYSSPVFHILYYGRIPITRTFKKGNIKQFELSRVKLNRKRSGGNENCFELAGGSSYRGFELPGDDCITGAKKIIRSTEDFVI